MEWLRRRTTWTSKRSKSEISICVDNEFGSLSYDGMRTEFYEMVTPCKNPLPTQTASVNTKSAKRRIVPVEKKIQTELTEIKGDFDDKENLGRHEMTGALGIFKIME